MAICFLGYEYIMKQLSHFYIDLFMLNFIFKNNCLCACYEKIVSIAVDHYITGFYDIIPYPDRIIGILCLEFIWPFGAKSLLN